MSQQVLNMDDVDAVIQKVLLRELKPHIAALKADLKAEGVYAKMSRIKINAAGHTAAGVSVSRNSAVRELGSEVEALLMPALKRYGRGRIAKSGLCS